MCCSVCWMPCEDELCSLEVLEVMRCVLLYILEDVEVEFCLLEVLEVLEVMCCVMLWMLEVVEGGLGSLEVLEARG